MARAATLAATPPMPRSYGPVLGQEAVEQALLADWQGERLPHAYLFVGRRGVGKATMAHRLARFILTGGAIESAGVSLFGDTPSAESLESAADSPVAARMAAGTHAGLLVIEPAYDEKKDRQKDEISVTQIRAIPSLLSLTAGEGDYRIVIIDPAESMGPSAANALLKWLEEPPSRTLFILISHNPSRLLPTIRSRCRKLTFAPLSLDACRHIAQAQGVDLGGDSALLAQFAGGSAGILRELAESNVVELFHELLTILRGAPAINELAAFRFAETVASSKRISWENWGRVVEELLAMVMRFGAGISPPALPDEELATVAHLASQLSPAGWFAHREAILQLHRDTELLYLDRKHVVLLTLFALAGQRFEDR